MVEINKKSVKKGKKGKLGGDFSRLGPVEQGILLFVISFTVFGLIQFSTHALFGYDGYFHSTISHILVEDIQEGQFWIEDFPWWQTSVFKEGYVDEYWLFHLLLAPFTLLGTMFGAKLFTVLMGSLLSLSLFIVMRLMKVKYAFLWIFLFLFGSSTFLIRSAFPRAILLSIVFLIWLWYVAIRRKFWTVGLLSYLLTISYPGFYLGLVIVGSAILGDLICTHKKPLKRWFFDSLILGGVSVLGMLLGLVINPYFPHTFRLVWTHGIHMMYTTFTHKLYDIGNEMYPLLWNLVLERSWILWLLFVISLIILGVILISKERKKLFSKEIFSALIIVVCFAGLSFALRRGSDYFVPFVVLFMSLFFSQKLVLKYIKKLSPSLIKMIGIVLGIGVIIGGISNVQGAYDSVGNTIYSESYAACAEWLEENSFEGEIVFHNNWDVFPFLFYENQKNYYLTGLAPDFMYVYNPELYWEYERLKRGTVEESALVIKELFNASYVFVDNRNPLLEKKLREEDRATLSYSNEGCVIFRLG